MLQINSSSLLGKLGLRHKWFCKTALKNGLVDVVASDIHENRPADLNKAFNKIKKPELFYNLGSEILNKK